MSAVALSAVVLAAAALLPASLHAQASPTGEQSIRLQAYVLASYVRPDFGGADRNGGGTVGATANVFRFHNAELGLDVRAVGSGGRVSNQYFYGGGPRVQLDYGRLEPFAMYHFGYGNLVFQQVLVPGYTHDNSLVSAFGAGLDTKISRQWAVRLEAERQSWQFSYKSPMFSPVAISAGLRYQFHFLSHAGPDF